MPWAGSEVEEPGAGAQRSSENLDLVARGEGG